MEPVATSASPSVKRSHHGILVLDKPAGPSSHEVVAWVRRAIGERRVGHCGTLDPAATGVLVVCVGEATKLVAWLTDDDKAYEATICLGRSTTTADSQGETLQTAEVSEADLARAVAAVAALHGPLLLSPPNVSAVRVDGVRAHARVRAGESFTLPTRTMLVHRAHLDAVDASHRALSVTFEVGKGTYIRSLAEHLGRLVDLPAHLGSLRRTRTGAFAIASAAAAGPICAVSAGFRPDGKPRHRLEPADGADREQLAARLRDALIPPHEAAPQGWPRAQVVDTVKFARLCNGVDFDPSEVGLEDPAASGAPFALFGGPPGSTAWVVAALDPGPPARVRPVRVLELGPPANA